MKYRHLFASALVLVLLGSCGSGRYATADRPSPTTQYTLENGLKVILKENHASPMVTAITCVGAGSIYEDDSNNGFSHFLEHLLFDGTNTRSRVDINEGIKDYGGYVNAFTRKEVTAYLILMPAEYAEIGLDIQADQLFNSIFPEEEFPKERKIVIEEIKMGQDNVDNLVEEFHDRVIFGDSPYHRPVIGNEQVISTIPREAVIEYWKSHYVPNNMTLLVIGDFDTEIMKGWVQKYYGTHPKRPLPSRTDTSFTLQADGRIIRERFPTQTTYVNITYSAPRYSDTDYYAFDLLTMYLNSEESSPLKQALTKGEEPLATEVNCWLDVQAGFTNFNVSVKSRDKKKAEAIVSEVDRVLSELGEMQFDEKDLRRFIVRARADEYYLEEKLHYYGIMRAATLQVCGYDFIAGYAGNLAQVTPDDVNRVARQYFTGGNYLATAALPES